MPQAPAAQTDLAVNFVAPFKCTVKSIYASVTAAWSGSGNSTDYSNFVVSRVSPTLGTAAIGTTVGTASGSLWAANTRTSIFSTETNLEDGDRLSILNDKTGTPSTGLPPVISFDVNFVGR